MSYCTTSISCCCFIMAGVVGQGDVMHSLGCLHSDFQNEICRIGYHIPSEAFRERPDTKKKRPYSSFYLESVYTPNFPDVYHSLSSSLFYSSIGNTLTVFRQAASQTSSTETPLMPATIFPTRSIIHGSLRPFTMAPSTHFSFFTTL